MLSTSPSFRRKEYANHRLLGASATRNLCKTLPSSFHFDAMLVVKSIDVTLANHVIFWPRETATLLKSNLRYFHHEKSTFEKFDAGLKLRIVFYTKENNQKP